MSAATSSSTSSIFAQLSDNQFKLRSHEDNITVTLDLDKSGPLVQNIKSQGPSLQYEGTEGTFSFSGQQVVTETTSLGEMFTVTLNVVPDLRSLSFTLLLPAVIHKPNTPVQAFDTIAIKSERHMSFQAIPTATGANPTYAVVKMHGTATKVEVPLETI